jgi:hypothetical protein
MLRNCLTPNHFVQSIVLQAADEIDFVGTPLAPKPIVRIAPVIHHDGSGREVELSGDLDIGHLSFGDPGKFGKITLMVQEQMKFNGPLRPTEMSPVKHAQTQVDGRRVETDQFVFETERLCPRTFLSNPFKQVQEELLIKLPGAMGIGIGQRGPTRSRNAQVFEFSFAAPQTTGDFSQRMGSTQLAEEHGDKLAPAGKPSGMSLGFRLFHGSLELDSRKQL